MIYKHFPFSNYNRASSHESLHGSAVKQKVMFCIELVNITFKQRTLGLNEMNLQFWIT